MKKIILFSLLSLVSGVQGTTSKSMDIDQISSENAREITYTITIRHDDKDEKYDKTRWKQLVDNALDVVKKVQTGERSGSGEKMIRGLSEAIEMVALEAVKGNSGIHGEMKISISDGQEEVKEEEVKKCGEGCPCIKKYKGICPCTAENNCSSSEQIRAACNESCQKTGCDTTKCVQTGCVK